MKKKSLSLARAFSVLLLCLLCLIPTAYANSGPRPEICITVINAPEGQIRLDLLVQDDSFYLDSAAKGFDPAILDNLRSLEGDGWVLSGHFTQFDSAQPQADGTWLFRRDGFSKPFRIAVATVDHAQASETPYTPRKPLSTLSTTGKPIPFESPPRRPCAFLPVWPPPSFPPLS